MIADQKKSLITLQLVSIYDSGPEKFVERVTGILMDSLSVVYEFMHIKGFSSQTESDLLLGDILPPMSLFQNETIHYIVFNLFDFESIEEIILRINEEIYGPSLVEIPDPNITYVVKVISEF